VNSALDVNGGSVDGGWRPLGPAGGATEVIAVRRAPETRADVEVGGAAGEADPAEGDPHGLFGPRSVTWRVHADPLVGVAALRSLTLRCLHPAGVAGVLATARDGDEPWEALGRTLRYVGVATFGETVEAFMASARLRSLHAQVVGVAPGGRYRGDDPDVLRWMHCCQVSSFLEVVRRGGLPLTAEEQDRYVGEQVRVAALLGLEPDEVPADRAGLAQYLRRMRSKLVPTPAARRFTAAVVTPPLPDVMAMLNPSRPAWAPVAGLAFAALPSWARKLYDLPFRSGPAALSPSATTVALHSLRESLLQPH
jgi:uncharacterized protein (DUF2236 family)